MAEKNPWSADHWNVTAQAAYLQAHGLARGEARARDAGTELGAKAPVTPATRRYLEGSFVFQREIVQE